MDWLVIRNIVCIFCYELYYVRKRREKKRKFEVNSEVENKENKCFCFKIELERDIGKVIKFLMFEILCE